ncbi:MFS transporter [Companilactobacillus mishanensis]|uniref:MFS transporter n=1 Tax=Companilactobacillus mishanensis TaxID=2486008 RepID=UPI00129643EC|nr:MFS transporter [Companilactobacillus mishanensis]MQS89742.1 MFS transporter [Companilactobacillus mishanensis]
MQNTKINTFKKKLALVSMALTGFMVILDTNIMNITIPEIQSALNVSLTKLSWAINIYTILFASFLIPFGRVGDKFGHVKMLNLALIIFGIGSLISGTAGSLSILLTGRAVQSIGAAIMLTTCMLIGFKQASKEDRPKIVSMLASTQALGAALGPSIGGFVSQYMGWHWVFLINLPIIAIVLGINLFTLPMKNGKTINTRIDIVDSVLLASTLMLLTLALVNGRIWGWLSLGTLSCVVSAAVLFLIFIIHDKTSKDPLIPLSLFKNRNFVASNIVILLAFTVLASFVGLIPTFLTKVMNVSELHAGLMVTPMSVALMVATPIATALASKINIKIPIGSGIATLATGIYLLSRLNVENGWTQLYIADVIIGLGIGFIAGPAVSIGVSQLEGVRLTAGQNVLNVMRNIGVIIGIALFMSLLDGNITTAKHNVYNYAVDQVSNVNLPQTSKNRIDHKLHSKLETSGQSQINSSNKVTTNKITTKQKMALENSAYKEVLAKKASTGVIIPAAVKIQLHQVIENIVEQKVSKINTQISTATRNIKHHMHIQLKHSFLVLYLWELPFVLASIPAILIYKES